MPFDETLRRRISWTLLIAACVSYLCLGLAQEGTQSAAIQSPPASPLPFSRDQVFGVDLRSFSSLQALNWLQAAGPGRLALIVVPIDADVVSALAREDSRPDALAAVDSLLQAAGESLVAACLRRPADSAGTLGIAQAAVGALTERYPDRIIYVAACDDDGSDEWQLDIATATLNIERFDADVSDALIPLSVGGPVTVRHLGDPDNLTQSQLQFISGPAYVVVSIDATEPIGPELIQRAESALRNSAHVALVLIRPAPNTDPVAMTASIRDVRITGDALPEGFSSVASPFVYADEHWQSSPVGVVPYLRSTGTNAVMAADFVGTDLYLLALQAPNAGQLKIWVDPTETGAGSLPDVSLNLNREQARDVALPIVEGLPAARHRVVIQAVNDPGATVAISGLFVAGRPAPAWTAALGSLTLMLIAIAAIGERSYASVVALRRRIRPPVRQPRSGHPRVFTRLR